MSDKQKGWCKLILCDGIAASVGGLDSRFGTTACRMPPVLT